MQQEFPTEKAMVFLLFFDQTNQTSYGHPNGQGLLLLHTLSLWWQMCSSVTYALSASFLQGS